MKTSYEKLLIGSIAPKIVATNIPIDQFRKSLHSDLKFVVTLEPLNMSPLEKSALNDEREALLAKTFEKFKEIDARIDRIFFKEEHGYFPVTRKKGPSRVKVIK